MIYLNAKIEESHAPGEILHLPDAKVFPPAPPWRTFAKILHPLDPIQW